MTIKPFHKIPQQEWMRSDAADKIFTCLQETNPQAEPQALFVGGCVRNALLGEPVEDIDLATPLTPDAVTQKLESAGIKVIPTGIDHGTVTAIIEENKFEITTLRFDDEEDGRRAVVSYTKDWIEDAKRRDFTMNTLLCDTQGNIFDPLECGLDDVKSRTIRFVGDPAERIKEDYLRILRFFRFHALYGQGNFDSAALQACEKAAVKIKTLSRERISQELFKIMASDKPAEIIETMFAHGILKEFAFKSANLDTLRHFCMFQSRYTLIALPARLYVFSGMDLDNIKAMEKRVLFPKVFLRDMQAIKGALALPDLDNDHAVRVAIYRHGRTIAAQTLMLELALDRVMNGYAPKALDIIQNWDIPDFPLTGTDMQKAGIKPGPQIGQTLRSIEDWWITEDFKPDRKECLDRLN